MSFYDDASLVVIPSAQKTSKLYAVKPTDGSGDLAFTRTGDTATRVNSAGIIEEVRTNLNTFSEQWDNAAYTSFRQNITANAGVAPNGTTTADKLIPTNVSGSHITLNSGNINSNGEYSISCYVKASGLNKVAIRESKSVGYYASFDLSNGTLLDSSAGQSNTITNVGNGWYRISSTRSYVGVISLGIVPLPDSYTTGDPMVSYVGDNVNGVLVWGGQTEFGTVTDYIPTLTAAVSTGPTANVPRLDYLGSTCPRLLLEPQRTNLLQFSEQFNNAYWSLSGATITSNTTVAPDGTQSADTLTGVSGNFRVFRVVSGLSNIDYSFSVFVKQGTSNTVKLDFVNVSDGPIFNFTTKTFTTVSGFTTRFEQHANGWFRLFATRVSNTTSAGLGINVAGAGQTVFIWGAQMEAGSYGTSYIPTLAASATRGADACSKTGISSLIGQTEGTLFAEFNVGGADGRVMSTLGGSNRFGMTAAPTSVGFFIVTAAGGVVYSSSASFTHGARTKMALAYKSGESVLYVNGSAVLTTTATFAFNAAITDLYLSQQEFAPGAGQTGKSQAQALLFKTRLTNAQLAELTTL